MSTSMSYFLVTFYDKLPDFLWKKRYFCIVLGKQKIKHAAQLSRYYWQNGSQTHSVPQTMKTTVGDHRALSSRSFALFIRARA